MIYEEKPEYKYPQLNKPLQCKFEVACLFTISRDCRLAVTRIKRKIAEIKALEILKNYRYHQEYT